MTKKPTKTTSEDATILTLVPQTDSIIEEPDWDTLLDDDLEVIEAKEYWRVITTELKSRNLLSPANGHAVQRLINFYLMYDRMFKEVAEHGMIVKAKRRNVRSIARVSPYVLAMVQMGNEATSLEKELGISPRGRDNVKPVQKKSSKDRASNAYLSQASR